jgi:hypothetical protein
MDQEFVQSIKIDKQEKQIPLFIVVLRTGVLYLVQKGLLTDFACFMLDVLPAAR